MVFLSAAMAAAAMASLFLPGRLWLLALTFGILAIGTGLAVYRHHTTAQRRLLGALASCLGGTFALVALVKVALTLAAVHHLAAMLG